MAMRTLVSNAVSMECRRANTPATTSVTTFMRLDSIVK